MTNQHVGLSQTLTAQHATDLRLQAAHQRRLQAARQPRRRTRRSPRRWWQLLAGPPSPRTS